MWGKAFTLVLVLSSVSALASKKPKHALETYPAITDEGSELEGVAALVPATSERNPRSIRLVRTAPVPVAPAFDTVPANQAESIARRLAVVEVLLRKYGRAYDYRSHTLHELQLILEQLDNAAAAGSSMSPVPASTEVQNP